jgi:hypothetical protein
MMRAFDEATLTDGRLKAKGPLETGAGQEAEHMHFIVCQGNAVARGSADVSEGRWVGFADSAAGITQGPAHGFGIAIVLNTQSPPSFETVTWFEPIEIT